MIGYIYYFFFILLTFSPLLLLKYKKSGLLILYPLLFTAHFNATVFLKAGITISFFELTLMISVCVILSNAKKNKTLKGLLNAMCFYNQDKIWLNFLGFSFLSILISIYRVYLFRDIVPDPAFSPPFFIRGIMSLNKFFFYFPLFFVIRGYFKQHYDAVITHKTFIKALAFSGILPAVAIFVQFLGIGFSMIHNNPSFAETFRVETYQGARPAGLTNEASFFVYQLFFSTLGLYYAKLHGFIQLKKYYSILLLYILAVILSLSRTGLLIYGIFFLLVWFRKNSIFSLKGLKNITIAIPIIGLVLFALSRISIANFNLGSRFLSTFDQGADASTLERYGSADALYHLLIDKTIFLGVGIYNYQYYIKSYLPSYMSGFYYAPGIAPASFNFIFQIFVEFGLVLALIFFIKCYINLKAKSVDAFVRDWFLFILIFSFSFQTLNFTIPFIVFFYSTYKLNEDNFYSR